MRKLAISLFFLLLFSIIGNCDYERYINPLDPRTLTDDANEYVNPLDPRESIQDNEYINPLDPRIEAFFNYIRSINGITGNAINLSLVGNNGITITTDKPNKTITLDVNTDSIEIDLNFTTDTNAETACNAEQVLTGDGTCSAFISNDGSGYWSKAEFDTDQNTATTNNVEFVNINATGNITGDNNLTIAGNYSKLDTTKRYTNDFTTNNSYYRQIFTLDLSKAPAGAYYAGQIWGTVTTSSFTGGSQIGKADFMLNWGHHVLEAESWGYNTYSTPLSGATRPLLRLLEPDSNVFVLEMRPSYYDRVTVDIYYLKLATNTIEPDFTNIGVLSENDNVNDLGIQPNVTYIIDGNATIDGNALIRNTLFMDGNILFLSGESGVLTVKMNAAQGTSGNNLLISSARGTNSKTDALDAGNGGAVKVYGENGGNSSVGNADGGDGGDVYVYGGVGGSKSGLGVAGSSGDVLIGFNGTSKIGNIKFGTNLGSYYFTVSGSAQIGDGLSTGEAGSNIFLGNGATGSTDGADSGETGYILCGGSAAEGNDGDGGDAGMLYLVNGGDEDGIGDEGDDGNVYVGFPTGNKNAFMKLSGVLEIENKSDNELEIHSLTNKNVGFQLFEGSNDNFGFSFLYDGAGNNDYYIIRHSDSFTGTKIIEFDRENNDFNTSGAIATGGNTLTGLSTGDINASIVYYDSLSAKSPVYFESTDGNYTVFCYYAKYGNETVLIGEWKEVIGDAKTGFTVKEIIDVNHTACLKKKQDLENKIIREELLKALIIDCQANDEMVWVEGSCITKIEDCLLSGGDYNKTSGECIENKKQSFNEPTDSP